MNIAMLLNPKCDISFLNSNDSVRQGLEKFKIHKYTAVPVLNDDGSYFGIISDKDFLTHILHSENYCINDFEDTKIGEIISRGTNPPVNINASAEELISRITDYNFVPVVDSRNYFVGIITRKSVINYLTHLIKESISSFTE